MALSQVTYTGNGVTQTFSLTFNYLNRSHVKVFVNGVEDTTFTWATASTVTLSSVPPVGAVVLIERVTPTAPIVDFVDGSNLTEVMLDTATRQGIYIAEETQDEAVNSLRYDPLTNTYPAGNRRITNIANPVNAEDAVTKNFLDTNYVPSINTAVSNAQASATTATTQAGIATAAANSALNSLDQFDDRYLGSKASAPTVDNDGNALLQGALYWNSVSKALFIWNGTAWVSTATAGVTSFNSRTGTVSLTSGDVTGALGFTPSNSSTTPTLAGANTFTGNNTFGDAGTDVTTLVSQLQANSSVGTSGQLLASRGSNLSPQWVDPVAGGFSNIQVFTASGTFTVPAGVTKVKATVVGGGGNGESRTLSTGNSSASGGGGGAAIGVYTVTPGDGIAVTVGGAGGTSSFGALASATGGGTPTGGIGSGGQLNCAGDGGCVISGGASNSGGGSIFGGGAASTTSAAGNSGRAYGGGGSGGYNSSGANAAVAGGAGAPGVVIVEW